MKLQAVALLLILTAGAALATSRLEMNPTSVAFFGAGTEPLPVPTPKINKRLSTDEQKIEARDQEQAGLRIDEPEVFDDSTLQQMLRDAEAKLASLQMFNEGALTSRLGTVSGASQDSSGFGLNIMGPSLPGVVTTQKGGTTNVVQTDKSLINTTGQSSSDSTTQTTTNEPTTDVQTTRAAASPLTVTAPAPTVQLPTTAGVASSKVLTEQMQLVAQIQSLRLLLRGSLSGHFRKPGPLGTRQGPKLKTTLGIPITINPMTNNSDIRYKNAVAIVEVEVQKELDIGGGAFSCVSYAGGNKLSCKIRSDISVNCDKGTVDGSGSFVCAIENSPTKLNCSPIGSKFTCTEGNTGERPLVTQLLPQEKTYNVAAISDKSMSIGGGVVTQVLGVSGSFLRGRKTYYLTQDQDTVALSFQPSDPDRIGFLWQFRPVLGREYVESGRKTVFVQLAFPAPLDALTGEIGTLYIKSYWRTYDRKKGVLGGIVPGSLSKNVMSWEIPRYDLNTGPLAFDSSNLVDLGDGQLMINLPGRFLPGTYVRIGNVIPPITNEYFALRFVASREDLLTQDVVMVAPDGTENHDFLLIRHEHTVTDPGPPVTERIEERAAPPIDTAASKITVETVDEANSKVTLELTDSDYLGLSPGLIFIVAGKVFDVDYPESEKRAGGHVHISAIIPNSVLIEDPKVTVTTIFAPKGWATKVDLAAITSFSKTDRLVVMEQVLVGDNTYVKFLLYGSRLDSIKPINPVAANIGSLVASENKTIRIVTMSLALVQANKFLILQRGNERPFAIKIPSVEVKDKLPEPKPQRLLIVNEDTATINGITAADIIKVVWNDRELDFGPGKENVGIVLSKLRGTGLTDLAETETLTFVLKSGQEVTAKLEVISGRVETVGK